MIRCALAFCIARTISAAYSYQQIQTNVSDHTIPTVIMVVVIVAIVAYLFRPCASLFNLGGMGGDRTGESGCNAERVVQATLHIGLGGLIQVRLL